MGASSSYPTPALPSTRTVIVTGGNTGIGYETAKAIARMGARVIIACRSEERAKEAMERMQKEHSQRTDESKSVNKNLSTAENNGEQEQENHEDPGSSRQLLLEYMHLDLSSLNSTVEFVEAFRKTGYPLHVLICNAGIAFANQALTGDGFETQFQVNYLSHLLLVLKLLPVMKQSVSEDARVVFVSSQMENWGEFNLDNIQGQQSYDRSKFYGNSKLYMVMTMFYLHRHLASQGITFCALHPGVVSTEINRNFEDYTLLKHSWRVMNAMGMSKTPEKGAATTINCSVNPGLAGVSGVFYKNCKSAQPSRLARDEIQQDALWKYSMNGLKDYVDENLLLECGFNDPKVRDDVVGTE